MTAQPETVLDILTADYWNAKNGDNKILFRKEGTGEVSHCHAIIDNLLFYLIPAVMALYRANALRSRIQLASAGPCMSR